MFFQNTFNLISRVFGLSDSTHTTPTTNITPQNTNTLAGYNKIGGMQNMRRVSYKRNQQSPSFRTATLYQLYGDYEETGADDDVNNSSSHTSPRDPRNAGPQLYGEMSRKRKADRELMPPPALTTHLSSPPTYKRPKRESLGIPDNYSETRSQRVKQSEVDELNEYDMRAARRKVAATQLPPNSGTWEPAERELFFHLSYRGFEPMLPKNWTIDFPTLPISLFATHEDQTPFIKCHKSTEFRAIRALRELFDTGKIVRDRVLSNGSVLRSEPIIERAAKRYIKWSMRDVGIVHRQCNPVHTVVAMKPGHTMADTIRELTINMHKLSARHREACNVLTSIEEGRAGSHEQQDGTQMHDGLAETEHKLPVIYGLMVCSSLLAVFTLNSYTPPPSFVRRALHAAHSMEDLGDEDDEDDDSEDSGLRFISSFDFSNSSADVWNAFVIAIVAIMIRQTLLDVYDIPIADNEPDYDESVLGSSMIDGDVECGHNRYTARYAVNKEQEFVQNRFRLEYEDDDPDL